MAPRIARFALDFAAAWGLAAACIAPASARVPPSPSEIASYVGLHAAAHRGDVARIASLGSTRRDLDSRDAKGRTPLQVATFASLRLADRQGRTPVQLAKSRGYAEMVRMLEAAGAH